MTPDRLPPENLHALLAAVRDGDSTARDQLVALLYDHLRLSAARLMRHVRPDHTLQPSALVHEALIKLISSDLFQTATDREHVYRAAVRAMRQVLIDHHRHRTSRKRPGAYRRHPLDTVLDHFATVEGIPFADLNEALDGLVKVDARACLVVTFHIFLGMSLPEVGTSLELSQKTVERDWRFARAWLRDQLKPDESRP
jgi:RNA polymerase sigma factor (TIGR02999 family)